LQPVLITSLRKLGKIKKLKNKLVIVLRKESKRKSKKIGIEAVVKPGVGALYVRGCWMKKLKDLSKRKRKPLKIR
jgi:hypothetical protein